MTPYMLAKEDNGAHLYIMGDIVDAPWTWPGEMGPVGLLDALKNMETNDVFVHINSCGGSVAAGITIYNLLNGSGMNVTTIAEGFCCSAASLIFMAGTNRIMRKSSLLMIHNAWVYTEGNAEQLRKTADDLDTISKTAAQIYKKANVEEEELKQMLDAETWIEPDSALSYGFATEISDDEITKGTNASAFSIVRNAVMKKREPELTPFQKYFKNFNKER